MRATSYEKAEKKTRIYQAECRLGKSENDEKVTTFELQTNKRLTNYEQTSRRHVHSTFHEKRTSGMEANCCVYPLY